MSQAHLISAVPRFVGMIMNHRAHGKICALSLSTRNSSSPPAEACTFPHRIGCPRGEICTFLHGIECSCCTTCLINKNAWLTNQHTQGLSPVVVAECPGRDLAFSRAYFRGVFLQLQWRCGLNDGGIPKSWGDADKRGHFRRQP
jgi:hypothetical protein